MRELRHLVHDIDRQLEDAVRAKQQLDAARWREQLRPCAMRLFAARAARLRWSRALVTALVDELHPDDLFTDLVGNLDRVPRRQWPHVVAVALVLRHSWRRDTFVAIAKRLHVSLPTHRLDEALTAHSRRPSRRQVSGAPRPCQGFPLRSNPSRGSRP
jgi:hypothetical protein